eukprot:TRINITY_DN13964_c0_g1_i1.p1 TRINITY_DN13964_c0_g1~~TRINITY_DN13964_c0_g1_i1.p1  ORF type:complete len:244 (+),score=43.41 TRINITY_DN13964_c0_g1_i1:59-790(+)
MPHLPDEVLRDLLRHGLDDDSNTVLNENTRSDSDSEEVSQLMRKIEDSATELVKEAEEDGEKWDLESVKRYVVGMRESQQVIYSLWSDNTIATEEVTARLTVLLNDLTFHLNGAPAVRVTKEEYLRQCEVICSVRLPSRPPGAIIKNAVVFFSQATLDFSWFASIAAITKSDYSVISIGNGFTAVILSSPDDLISFLSLMGFEDEISDHWVPIPQKNALFVRHATTGDAIQYHPVVSTTMTTR